MAALRGVTFTLGPGRVTGMVGPNGAGKSTLMRVILGLDRPDAGRALVDGRPYRDLPRPLTRVGSLLDASAPHPARSARDHLRWLAHSQGIRAADADPLLDRVGLAAAARRRVGGFSLGMRQRLGIAAALLGDPAALLLDEPFNGLDPEGIVWMRELLAGLAAEGRAVLVSSHLIGELQHVAQHLIVIGAGRVVADAPVPDLLAAQGSGGVGLEDVYFRLTHGAAQHQGTNMDGEQR
ncbi:ATP-binding cassette domain-containing protein [Catenulispora yoronensis]|uniref:ATP-binding cassette domain-containing protein n=1 Tax=Catenulispora yoronensis TaxID=450799 RepID=A0ABN2TJS0_9ACTN